MIWTASRICASAAEYFRPCHCSTMIRLDSPMPSATRPGARWPSVAALMPSSVGVRVCTGPRAEMRITGRQYTRRPPMRLVPELALTPEGWRRDVALAVTDGRIAHVGVAQPRQPGDVMLPGRALLPGTVNAHCHTFQSLLRGL